MFFYVFVTFTMDSYKQKLSKASEEVDKFNTHYEKAMLLMADAVNDVTNLQNDDIVLNKFLEQERRRNIVMYIVSILVYFLGALIGRYSSSK
jgi:hypothetical protein